MKLVTNLIMAAFGVSLLAVVASADPSTTNIIASGTAITNSVTWSATNVHLMGGPVFVVSNGVLNIEAGTIVKGVTSSTNAAEIAALYVCRGGKIYANGTANSPIIFTSINDVDVTDPGDLGIYDRGLWGGIILFGKARLNTASLLDGNAATPKYDVYEGLSTNVFAGGQQAFLFGSDDDEDNSGVLRYVSIRHGGKKLESNKEINGLSMCGVGRGTTIEFVESYAIADDGFEWFGGTVNTRYLVSAFNDDETFDTDEGYRGKNQFWFAIQESGARDRGFEFNGEPDGVGTNATLKGKFEVYNATIIGAGTNTGGNNNNAMNLKGFASPQVYNSIFTDFAQRGVAIDKSTYTNLLSGDADFKDNLWWGFTAGNTIANICISNDFQYVFTNAGFNNDITNPQLRSIARLDTGLLDPRPEAGSPALLGTRLPPATSQFLPVTYKGAFNTVNWAADWTTLGAYGIMSGNGAGTPRDELLISIQPSTDLSTAISGQLGVCINTLPGWNYQVQTSTNLAGWTNIGSLIHGSGAMKYLYDAAITSEPSRYYRVRALKP